MWMFAKSGTCWIIMLTSLLGAVLLRLLLKKAD